MILTGESRWVRIVTFVLLYFAQGIPIGLLDIAMPAWLAQNNFSDAQIGGFLAVVGLPWAFKLIAGPFMDRYSLPSLGRRRPWVLAAQVGLLLALLSLTSIQDPQAQIAVLTTIGFLVNCFGATQDVAVDGMAIDVVPVAERGRVNAFMAFGQVLGYSGFGALCGVLLASQGLAVAALACAVAVACILVWITLTKERQRDRYLPSFAKASSAPQSVPEATITLPGIFKDLSRVLLLPLSLVLLVALVLERIAGGMLLVVVPIFAVKELGIASADYSQLFGLVGGIAAVAGLLIGPLVDRFGAKSVLLIAMLLNAVVLIVYVGNPQWWSNTGFSLGAFVLWAACAHAAFVGVIAMCMNVCWWKVAATQFAVYMAVSNLGRSMGAGLFAGISEHLHYTQIMHLIAAVFVLASLALLAFHQERQRGAIDALDASIQRRPDAAA